MACNLSILATLKYFLSGINMYVSFVFAFARDSLPPPPPKEKTTDYFLCTSLDVGCLQLLSEVC